MPRSPSYPFNRTIPEIIGDARRPRPKPDTSWYEIGSTNEQNVDFQNGFSGDPDRPPAYMLGQDGFARCRGVIIPPTDPVLPLVAFTFPEEIRPENPEPFLLGVLGGGYANGYVDINGEVVIEQIVVS